MASTTPLGALGRGLAAGVAGNAVMTGAQNNGMHWAYGISWGAVYGLVAGSLGPRAPRAGLALGLAAWGASLVQLPAMKLAPPVWESPPSSLAPDVGFHLVYGVAAAGAFRALD